MGLKGLGYQSKSPICDRNFYVKSQLYLIITSTSKSLMALELIFIVKLKTLLTHDL